MRRGETEAREGEGRRVAPERCLRSHGRIRSLCGALAAGAVLLTASVCGKPTAASANVALEYEVKAAFLFRFAQFVEWPADTFKGAGEPFTYCTIGDDPFHGALERTLNGKMIGQRALRVEHLSGTGKIGGCQVLFVGGSGDRKHVEEMLADTGKLPILTVGEADRFAENGGAIGFCTEDNKIRFEVNLDAAGKAGLKISAKLLALAKTVLGVPKGT
jgi:YfiR/HmsC-like